MKKLLLMTFSLLFANQLVAMSGPTYTCSPCAAGYSLVPGTNNLPAGIIPDCKCTAAPSCPAGTVLSGSNCVGSPSCPAGTARSGSTCVANPCASQSKASFDLTTKTCLYQTVGIPNTGVNILKPGNSQDPFAL